MFPQGHSFRSSRPALPEIWSYGHRNPQGLALHPDEGELWEHEHGPRGGDEVNIVRRGGQLRVAGITYGREYTGEQVGAGISEKEGLEQPVYYRLPSIAPGGWISTPGRPSPAGEGVSSWARWRAAT